MDKNVKAMMKISDVLDDRYEKLCDRYHELELSHNRKKKALLAIRSLFVNALDGIEFRSFACSLSQGSINRIVETIDNALFCDGRERSKR